MIEDKATEKLKEKAKELGLIVNAGTSSSSSNNMPRSKDKTRTPVKKKGLKG